VSHDVATGIFAGFGQEYRFFSEDLSSAVEESEGPYSRPESEGASEAFPAPTDRTPYVRHNTTCGLVRTTCYEPVVTGTTGEGDVPSGIRFGGNPESALGAAVFVGASPDAGHVVVSSSVGLSEQLAAPRGGLYEWSAGSPARERLQLVSILPEEEGGEPAPSFELGRDGVARNAISADGSRVFFSARASGQEHEHLYVRDTTRGETIRLDEPEGVPSPPSSAQGALFQSASSNGSEVFFTDPYPLTGSAGRSGSDLYECKIVEVQEAGSEKLACVLSDLTPVPASGEPGEGEPANVQGNVLGASENGDGYAYFVADGVQAAGASQGDCEGVVPLSGETCNLYVRHEGLTSLIATLSSDDSPDWAASGPLDHMTARVSPDGEWLAFMSDRELTGYDNRDAKSGLPDEEVYLYEALSHKLVCASCNPTGERPAGMEYAKLNITKGGLVGGDRVWKEGQWLAANVPGWTAYTLNQALYDSRYLSDSGRLFFNSSDALVPGDTNGNEDVYEYEPVGVGPAGGVCSASSSLFDVSAEGCLGLISSGLGFGQSAFLDASATGSDVFFLTAEKLVARDTGSGIDVYDAHECSVGSPCVTESSPSAPECVSAASCRVAPLSQPPIFGAPASATFSGAGNVTPAPKPVVKQKTIPRTVMLAHALKACKRVFGRRRALCERTARKRYGKLASRRLRVKRSMK